MMKTTLRHMYEIYIRATPEQIWQAITTGELSKQYFWDGAVESDWTVDAPIRYVSDGALMIDGVVLEADPPRKLVHTFKDHWAPETANDPPSRVSWEIEPRGEECRVTLVHDGFETPNETYAAVANGWPPILSGLKSLVETGKALSIAWPEGTDIRTKPETKGHNQIHQIYVNASADRVWDAITQDEHMGDFFPGRLRADEWKVGSRYRVQSDEGTLFEGTILELEKPRRFSYTFENRWEDEGKNERPSRVTFELTPMGDACRIIVVHDDFDEVSQTFEGVERGWPSILSHMKSYLETGRPTSTPA